MKLAIIVQCISIFHARIAVLSSPTPAIHSTDFTPVTNGDSSELSALREVVNQMKHQLENVTGEKADLEKRIEELEKNSFPKSFIDAASRTTFPDVTGFTAQLDNTIHDLPTDSTVIYDGTWYNGGGGYDKTTGIFTCPQSGVYLFAIFVETDNTDEAEIALVIDGSYRISAISERASDGHDSTGGNVLIEHIQKGQRVWVQTIEFDNQDIYKYFSTFSGVLIQST